MQGSRTMSRSGVFTPARGSPRWQPRRRSDALDSAGVASPAEVVSAAELRAVLVDRAAVGVEPEWWSLS
jgi:hypothetical protein